MFCEKCGSQIPDDAMFCPKCGAKQEANAGAIKNSQQANQASNKSVLAENGVSELKCPGCGAPIKPQFGEMVITCEYCGSSISLADAGWTSISKHSMLPITLSTKDQAQSDLKSKMDCGLLHRHLQEQSTLEELNLSYVPYWIVPVSSRTNYTAVDAAAEIGTIAATAAIMGLAGGAMGGNNRGGLGIGMVEGTMMGGMMMGGMGGGGTIRAYQLNENYNYPVVGVKALTQYQPRDYSFDLSKRVNFDTSKIPKGIKILNGDVGEDSSEYEAKTIVGQIQAAKAHAKHHMIRSMNTQSDTGEPELLHAPIWFARYEHKGRNIVLVLDASSGGVINSIGID